MDGGGLRIERGNQKGVKSDDKKYRKSRRKDAKEDWAGVRKELS